MSDIQEWIDEGRALTAESTEGPWEARMESPTMGGEVWTLRTGGQPGIKMVVSEYQFGEGNSQFIADARTRLPQALDVIQAVLDMHRPSTADTGEEEILFCPECFDVEDVGEVDTWPCPTVQAIHDAIKETEA